MAAGEVTGVVATGGWFRSQASDGYTAMVAFPAEGMEEFWALGRGDPDEVPEDRRVNATMPRDRAALEQIDGLVLAEVEDSRFTLRGLDPNKDYWFCAGEIHEQADPVRVGLHVCDKPEVHIPGSITAWSGQVSKIRTYEAP